MSCIGEPHAAFTLDQLAVLSLWSVASPMGLVVRIAYKRPQVRYLMNPTSRGTVVVVRPAGGKWELPTVKTALAKVLLLEQWNADA